MIGDAAAVWRFRHFLLALVGLDVRRRYARSVLGTGWSVLQPLATAAVFGVVFSHLLGDGSADYTVSVILGTTVWGFFKECAVGGSSALLAHETYIRQSPLPFALYPLRLVLGAAVHSGLAFLAALGLAAVVHGSLAPLGTAWAILPALPLAVAFGWALAAVGSCAQVYFQDTAHLLEVAAQLGFFLTPILYPASLLEKKGLGLLVTLNPVNVFLDLARTPVMAHRPPPPETYAAAAAVTAGAVGLAAAVLARAQKRLVFRL